MYPPFFRLKKRPGCANARRTCYQWLVTLQANACAFRWLSGEFEMCAHLRWRGSGNLLPMLLIRVHAILLAVAVFRLTGGLNGSTIGP